MPNLRHRSFPSTLSRYIIGNLPGEASLQRLQETIKMRNTDHSTAYSRSLVTAPAHGKPHNQRHVAEYAPLFGPASPPFNATLPESHTRRPERVQGRFHLKDDMQPTSAFRYSLNGSWKIRTPKPSRAPAMAPVVELGALLLDPKGPRLRAG